MNTSASCSSPAEREGSEHFCLNNLEWFDYFCLNNLEDFEYFCLENGSSQGQNLALTDLTVPNSPSMQGKQFTTTFAR